LLHPCRSFGPAHPRGWPKMKRPPTEAVSSGLLAHKHLAAVEFEAFTKLNRGLCDDNLKSGG
jgi:hypothetical protein